MTNPQTLDQQLDNHQFLRKRQLVSITGLSYPTLHRLQQAGRFPRPHRITNGTSVWLKGEVLSAMKALLKNSY